MVQPLSVRLKFYKVGSLQYISHLDLVRTLTRSILRAGIPGWYSQGFNPRLKLTFSLPLSIGTQSEFEFFDMKLVEPMEFDEIKRRINENLTNELQIVDVYEGGYKFSEIGWALYEIKMTSPKLSGETAQALAELYNNELVLTKRSKSGDKEVDISKYIDLQSCEYGDGSITVRALLSADSEGYLNPEYLIKAAEQKLGVVFEDPFEEYYTIVRKSVYLSDKKTLFR